MSDISPIRFRRTVLYVPASHKRALEKAKQLNVDSVIFDLEDAVAIEQKSLARDWVCQAVASRDYGHREMIIRINGLDTEWGHEDLEKVMKVKPHVVLLPKVNTATDIYRITEKLSSDIALWVMLETPLSLLNIAEIVACSTHTPLSGLVMGTNDLAKELGTECDVHRTSLQYALSQSVLAARAYGLVVLDGVYNHLDDLEGLRAEAEQAKAFGFDGKTLIHPQQIDGVHAVFTPSDAEIKQARVIIEAFELPENKGKAVLRVNGQMVEILHLKRAKKILRLS